MTEAVRVVRGIKADREAVKMAAAEVVVVMVAEVEAATVAVMMAAATAATVAVIMAAATAATAAAIMDLIALTLINLLEQKVGKTEVMEILLITLNMKMVGAEEKGECPMRAMLQTRQISNPFLQALSLI